MRSRRSRRPRRAPRSGAPPSATSAATRLSWSSRRGPRTELVRGQPHAGLRGHVLRYSGWEEFSAEPLLRIEMPFAGVPVIVCFGVPYRLDGERFETFVAGMTDRPVATEFTGAAGGVQIDLTPLGARRILGIPMEELTRLVVAVEELLGRELVERLRDAPGWRERFALLDSALLRRVEAGPAPAPEVAWSYARLAAADGRVAAGALAEEVGWSRRHLAARWRRDVGMGPKAVARVLRFQRALRLLRDGRALADIAYDCGFADQPHLTREFRALGGSTPREVTNLQDAAATPV